jgi:hypothetical protein
VAQGQPARTDTTGSFLSITNPFPFINILHNNYTQKETGGWRGSVAQGQPPAHGHQGFQPPLGTLGLSPGAAVAVPGVAWAYECARLYNEYVMISNKRT